MVLPVHLVLVESSEIEDNVSEIAPREGGIAYLLAIVRQLLEVNIEIGEHVKGIVLLHHQWVHGLVHLLEIVNVLLEENIKREHNVDRIVRDYNQLFLHLQFL